MMPRSAFRWLALGLPLVLPAMLMGCRRETPVERLTREVREKKEEVTTALGQVGQVQLKGWQLQGGDARGRPLWSIGADRAVIEKSQGSSPVQASLYGARATLYEAGQPASAFRAGRMTWANGQEGIVMVLRDKVEVRAAGRLSPGDERLAVDTRQVEIRLRPRLVLAPGVVTLRRADVQVKAASLRSDLGVHRVRLQGPVAVTTPRGEIGAAAAEWDWKADQLRASGPVEVRSDNWSLRGTSLHAVLDARRGTIQGPVQARHERGQATAGQVEFDWGRRTVQASRRVQLHTGAYRVTAGSVLLPAGLDTVWARDGVQASDGTGTLRAASLTLWPQRREARATGGVRVVRGTATLRAGTLRTLQGGAIWEAARRVELKREGWRVTAGEARVLRPAGGELRAMQVTAWNGVTLQGPAGSVRAGRVVWSGGQVTATGGVNLAREGHQLSGSRLHSDDRFTVAKLEGEVRARLRDGTRVSSPVLWWKEGRVRAEQGIQATRGELQLRARQLVMQRDGRHVELSGGVRVTNKEGSSLQAPWVRYDAAGQRIYAGGGVVYHDAERGWRQEGKTLIADLRLRNAVMTEVRGSGSLRLFGE